MGDRGLRRPFFALLGLNFLVWFAGYQVFSVVPLHLRDLGASLAGSGRFAAFLTVGTASGALLMGRLSDRLGHARTFRGAGAGLMATLFVYALFDHPLLFLLLAPLHGLLWAGLKTSAMSLATQLLPLEERTAGLSWYGLSGALGVALGPLVGLALFPMVGFRLQMILTALAFLLIVAAPGLPPREPVTSQGVRGPWPGRVILVPALLLLAWGWGQGLLPPFSAQEARLLGTGWPAAMLTSFALGMILSRTLFGVLGRRLHPMTLVPFLMVGGLLATGMLALMPGGVLRHGIGGLLFGASLGLAHTLLFAHAVTEGGPRRGESVGLMYLAYELGMGLGAAVVGQAMEGVAHHWGSPVGFRAGWAMGGGLLLLALPLAIRARKNCLAREAA